MQNGLLSFLIAFSGIFLIGPILYIQGIGFDLPEIFLRLLCFFFPTTWVIIYFILWLFGNTVAFIRMITNNLNLWIFSFILFILFISIIPINYVLAFALFSVHWLLLSLGIKWREGRK